MNVTSGSSTDHEHLHGFWSSHTIDINMDNGHQPGLQWQHRLHTHINMAPSGTMDHGHQCGLHRHPPDLQHRQGLQQCSADHEQDIDLRHQYSLTRQKGPRAPKWPLGGSTDPGSLLRSTNPEKEPHFYLRHPLLQSSGVSLRLSSESQGRAGREF